MKEKLLKHLKVIVYILLPFMGGGWLGAACSKNDATTDVHANWKERNDVFFASLEDSLTRGIGTWRKLPSYSKTPKSNTDYVYVKVIPTGFETTDTVRPLFNDSVRVSYQGRIISTEVANSSDGKIFDGTVYGDYNVKTNATARFKVSGTVLGFTTALLHMHRGDTWRVYIPYALGYGAASQTGLPAYSTLIFDMTLYAIAPEGTALPNI
jgi:FKBP-type peptidyl-prolyl cis-trans isomerase FklB